MVDITKTCSKTGKAFLITDEDQVFYQKMNVPHPTLCPSERERRRWAWRGKNFYIRTCDNCKQQAMAWYSPELTDIKTYCEDCYRKDDFDATVYGRDFDFNRPFFEQFAELLGDVPRHISNAIHNENCKYIISAHKNKSCYYTDEIDFSRDCYFSFTIQKCSDIVEGLYVSNSEICYQVINADSCYHVFYSQNVWNCNSSAFLTNCRGVKNSLFCANLRNKEYHIYNQPVSRSEFERVWAAIFTGKRQDLEHARGLYEEFMKSQPFPATVSISTEGCTGNYLLNCKNVKDSFNVDNSRDCRYSTDLHYSTDCYDCNLYSGERVIECVHMGPDSYNLFYSNLLWFCSDVFYSVELNGCQECFGCVGLKKEKFCIFNKKYSEEEYRALKAKIIEHMIASRSEAFPNGEFGEFFPMQMSPYPYNQTMAQRFAPSVKEQIVGEGLRWLEEPSGRAQFRLIPQEIVFYDKYGIPHPETSPDRRLEALWEKLGGRKLYDRTCAKTGVPIQTIYPPEDPRIVYSNEAYLEAVY